MRVSMALILAVMLVVQPLVAETSGISRTWSELAQSARHDWHIRLRLPDGTTLEGNDPVFDDASLRMFVKKSGDRSKHPLGITELPRIQVTSFELRGRGIKGRVIGTLAPMGAGIAIMGAGVSQESWGGLAVAFAGLLVFVGGTIAGFSIGRASDRRCVSANVAP